MSRITDLSVLSWHWYYSGPRYQERLTTETIVPQGKASLCSGTSPVQLQNAHFRAIVVPAGDHRARTLLAPIVPAPRLEICRYSLHTKLLLCMSYRRAHQTWRDLKSARSPFCYVRVCVSRRERGRETWRGRRGGGGGRESCSHCLRNNDHVSLAMEPSLLSASPLYAPTMDSIR